MITIINVHYFLLVFFLISLLNIETFIVILWLIVHKVFIPKRFVVSVNKLSSATASLIHVFMNAESIEKNAELNQSKESKADFVYFVLQSLGYVGFK